MSSAGRSSMSDTQRSNLPGDQVNPPGTSGPLMPGEAAPEEQIEVVEFVAMDDSSDDIFDNTAPGGFRWWYVPAIGVPVAVGTGAAIWYLAKGSKPYQNAWELATRSVRTLTGQPRVAATTKKARRKSRATPDTLRDKVTSTLSGLDATELTRKAGDLWDDARDSMVDLWDQVTDRDTISQARGAASDASDAARRQIGAMVGSIAAAGTALAIQKKAGDLAGAARERANAARATTRDTARRMVKTNVTRPARRALLGAGMKGGAWLVKNRARSKASDLTDSARERAERIQRRGRFWMARNRAQSTAAVNAIRMRRANAAKQARTRISSSFRRTGTFALSALVTAMIIYVRSWYSRRGGPADSRDAGDVRETAGGRMVTGTWPRIRYRASDAAAPTTASSPVE